jgi:glutathione S-transferase
MEAKPLTPYGQLPLLIADGEVISQSGAIARYCATLVPGLVPADPIKAAQCDAIFENAQELMSVNPIVNVFKDEKFAATKKEYFETQLPPRLKALAKLLGDGPFFMGDKPTYCDFGCYHVLSSTKLLDPSAFEAYPNVGRFLEAIEALAGVNEYLSKRPAPVDIGTKPMLSPSVVGSRPSPAEASK